jgi:pyridinium-3,5-biscarboxylic acid mononucleotide synthase
LNESTLKTWLAQFKAGDISESELLERLRHLPFEDLDFAKIDHHRALRRGFPEVIYGEGKDLEQILAIAAKLKEHGNPVLITRLDEAKIAELLKVYPKAKANPKARTVTIMSGSRATSTTGETGKSNVRGLVISAGTSDIAVAEEAAETLEAFGYACDRLYDVGVAGLHRLMAHRELISKADAIAVVAGMEGALASVVGGLVNVPVIAVPTSVGYGASFGGISALLGMLTGCSGGVAVVNIDSGFAAGYMLAVILRNLGERRVQEH